MRFTSLALGCVLLATQHSCYHLPLWKGEVTVTARERESIKKCGTGALTEDGAKSISRHPYLQATTTTSTTVAWGSLDAKGEVVFSEPGGAPLATIKGVYVGDPARQQRRLDKIKAQDELGIEDTYVLAAQVDGLEPTHLYCYQLIADGKVLTELAPLTTAAAPKLADPIHFVALGDSGTGGAAQIAIGKRISVEPFDLMLFLGDIAYEAGTAQQLETKFFAIYRDFLRYVPAYPTLGNHERRTKKGAAYFEAFVLPAPERYYSFDWGDVHFVAIDTTQRDAKQLAWLDADLKKNKLPWVIVYGHHPMYTNSLRGPQLWIRRAFAKIFTDHKVDLVLTGHEHQYERFRVGGVNYVVSGGGGGQLTRLFGRSRALAQATVHHFLAFEVSATKLEMRAVDIEGRTFETLKLDKPPGEDTAKVKDKVTPQVTPIAPEKTTVPDEKLHDGPDDDEGEKKVTPATPPQATTGAPPVQPAGAGAPEPAAPAPK